MMRFSRLCLLSTREGRAFEIDFSEETTVIEGPNGHGKSAIAKSLYHTLGAAPHKIDKRWKSAGVTSLLQFQIGEQELTAVRARDRFVVCETATGKQILDTTHIGGELSPFLAQKLDFGLLLTNKQEELVIPPPSYAFAPFYVDQDGGWQKPWSSFTDFYLSNSAQSLSDYHTGRRTNEYYRAYAALEHQLRLIRRLEEERRPLAIAIDEISSLTANLAINLDVNSFEDEIDELAKRTTRLNDRQANYRENINLLSNQKSIWMEQRSILRLALIEMDKSISLASEQPDEIDCPTCGHSYSNSITNRFGLISDYDDIFDAIQDGEAAIRKIDDELGALRRDLGAIEVEISQIDEILSVRKDDISLGDIISAQGRTETTNVLRAKIREIDALIGEAQAKANEAEKARKQAMDAKRSAKIRDYFDRRKADFASKLDALIQEPDAQLRSPKTGRGSEGARELLAYYYAVLYCQREFSSSMLCPIVIDGANQQGQDAEHRRIIYNFLIDEKPADAQLIFTAEEPDINSSNPYEIVAVGVKERQLMSEEKYDAVFEELRPYLDTFL